MAFSLRSPAFSSGKAIPKKHTGDGEDVSPALAWDGAPDGTREFALVCDDPDAPSRDPWVHWLLYKIPADTTQLPEGLPARERLDELPGALQGRNSWTTGRVVGYRGPKPPSGTHRYFFNLYALSSPLTADPGLDKAGLLRMMEGRILGQAELMGTYSHA
jgi:Raf kinase inhibitor-like YbhB/YbcL family protein